MNRGGGEGVVARTAEARASGTKLRSSTRFSAGSLRLTGRLRLSILVSVLVPLLPLVVAAPLSARQGSGSSPLRWSIEPWLASFYDSNVARQDSPNADYGGTAAARSQLVLESSRQTLQLGYDLAAHRYAESADWNRLNHVLRGSATQRLGRRLRLEIGAEAARGGTNEDRERSDVKLAHSRLELRLGSDTRVRLTAAYRTREGLPNSAHSTPNPYAGVDLRQRLESGHRWEMEFRYEEQHGDDPRQRFTRWIYATGFAAPLGGDDLLELSAKYQSKLYEERLVRRLEVPRHDHKWTATATWTHTWGWGTRTQVDYSHELRRSNDPARAYGAHLVSLTVRPPAVRMAGRRPVPAAASPPGSRPVAGRARGSAQEPGQHSLTVGGGHACVLTPEGRPICWGDPPPPAGGPPAPTSERPVPLLDLTVLQLSAGQQHTCGLSSRQEIFCWAGGNLDGGASMDEPRAWRVARTPTMTAVATGANFACGLGTDAMAYCWRLQGSVVGRMLALANRLEATPVVATQGLMAITAGSQHACGLTFGGEARCWGSNEHGQLGRRLPPWSDAAVPISGPRFSAISAGARHTCGLAGDGTAHCWGANESGQLGNGTTEPSMFPVPVAGDLRFVQITAGVAQTCALDAGGAAYCWGSDSARAAATAGSARRPSLEPVRIEPEQVFTSIQSFVNTCALPRDGSVYCWGTPGSASGSALEIRNP